MRFAVISDTHSNRFTYKAYEHLLEYKDRLQLDFVLFNGDIIGHFSLAKSTVHRHQNKIPSEQIEDYLREAAPNFYDSWRDQEEITKQLLYEYVGERYSWIYTFLKQSSKQIKTVWNLGNHESKHYYLVLQELPFLTQLGNEAVQALDRRILDKIYDLYEESMVKLEEKEDFHYIRNKPLRIGKTLFIGIPGESHIADGNDDPGGVQEAKTKSVLSQAEQYIDSVDKIIICNHTQAKYNAKYSFLQPASPSAKEFIDEYKEVKEIVWIQSHNHWSYTQFMKYKEVSYILNNAGLHDGIYNIVDTQNEVSVYDVSPEDDEIQKLFCTDTFGEEFQDEQIKIARNYSDPKSILARKKRYSTSDSS